MKKLVLALAMILASPFCLSNDSEIEESNWRLGFLINSARNGDNRTEYFAVQLKNSVGEHIYWGAELGFTPQFNPGGMINDYVHLTEYAGVSSEYKVHINNRFGFSTGLLFGFGRTEETRIEGDSIGNLIGLHTLVAPFIQFNYALSNGLSLGLNLNYLNIVGTNTNIDGLSAKIEYNF